MKKLLFIILFLFLFLTINVYAAEKKEEFYAGEWIPNTYINGEKNGVIHYSQGRLINKKSDNGIAYCIEPFELISEDSKYTGYDNYQVSFNISKDSWNRINLLAYYGYGYGNHSDKKWYAVTQLLIWREVDKKASFYFTDKLNGTKISKYESEIKELNNIVSNHSIISSFANKSLTFSINSTNEVIDNNNVISNYNITNSDNIKITQKENKLLIETFDKGISIIDFKKKFSNYKTKSYVFVDNNHQNLITPGNVDDISFKLNLNIVGGKIRITKLDYDSESKTPSGEGILIGSKYAIYNDKDEKVQDLIIDDNCEAETELLPFGRYTIKEEESMTGYYLDENVYEVVIDENNTYVELKLKNKIIKSKVTIKKYFGDKVEGGISFQVYDVKGDLVKTLTTDENGIAETELPYGKYLFHQVNTTKNYKLVDDFELIINEESSNEIMFELYDEIYSSKLTILKKDLKTNELISEEASFKIYDKDRDEYFQLDGKDTFKTKNGIITIDKVPAGNYYLEEYKSPKGYKKSTKKIEFTIDDEGESYIELEVYNEKEEFEVKVPDTSSNYSGDFYLISDDKKKKLFS